MLLSASVCYPFFLPFSFNYFLFILHASLPSLLQSFLIIFAQVLQLCSTFLHYSLQYFLMLRCDSIFLTHQTLQKYLFSIDKPSLFLHFSSISLSLSFSVYVYTYIHIYIFQTILGILVGNLKVVKNIMVFWWNSFLLK